MKRRGLPFLSSSVMSFAVISTTALVKRWADDMVGWRVNVTATKVTCIGTLEWRKSEA